MQLPINDHSNLSPILSCFSDIAGFLLKKTATPLPIQHKIWGMFPLV